MAIETQTLALTVRFFLPGINTPIILSVWDDAGVYRVTSSHALKTPWQASPDVPRPSDFSSTPQAAAQSVVNFMHADYLRAVQDGDEPSSTWLIPEV